MGEINVVAADSPLATALKGAPGRRLGFRPESAVLATDGISAAVKHVTYLGSKTELLVETASGESLKLWTRAPLSPGQTLHFRVNPERLILFQTAPGSG
jgi:ABC-type sugar transport system ATPase subunit